MPSRITRRSVLISLPAICSSVPYARAGSGPRAKSEYHFGHVRDQALAAVSARRATGIALAAVHRGRIVWEQAFGWANRELRLPATVHTPFSLASISKTFTATALATLAQEGRLALDERANRYLGSLSLRGVEAESATVRQLGAHASGLPALFEMFPTDSGSRPPSVETLLQSFGRLAFPPAKLYEYSNIGYAALGAIAERLTGRDIGALIMQRVLAALEMRTSFFDTQQSALAHAAARYDELNRPIRYYTTATPASGEVYASAHDLALFALFNLKHRTAGRAPVLSERWIDELHAPVLHGPAAGATTFGWFSGRSNSGLGVLFKDGGQPGVSTIMYLVPSEELGCLVLTNRSDNGPLVQILVDLMVAAVLPGWTTPDTRMNPLSAELHTQVPYVGRWSGTLSGAEFDAKLELAIRPGAESTLSIDANPKQQIVDLQLRGQALVGVTSGGLPTRTAARGGTGQLSLELLPYEGSLVGRLLATAASPGMLATIPFIASLDRSHERTA